MEVTDAVRMALRLKTKTFDEEIVSLIDACKVDLHCAGVDVIQEEDPFILQAIRLYCKAYFGENERAEQFLACYESMKQQLSLSTDYRAEKGADENTAVG